MARQMLTLSGHEKHARDLLQKANVDSPGLCARLLTAFAAGLTRSQYVLASGSFLSPDQAAFLETLVARRATGEPLAYILGRKEFYSLDFYVNASVLTPRPETELLVDLALKFLPQKHPVSFTDIGCGSGCIGITLGALCPEWRCVLVDNSFDALAVCRQNLVLHGVEADLLQADMFQLPFSGHAFDLIISNPPYIDPAERELVMWETLAHEPHSALFSAGAGLDHLKALIQQACLFLKPGGVLLLEHGDRQGWHVASELLHAGFQDVKTHPDLAGLPRATMGIWQPSPEAFLH